MSAREAAEAIAKIVLDGLTRGDLMGGDAARNQKHVADIVDGVIRTAAAAEREACAKIPEGLRGGDDTERAVLLSVARAIRARGAS